MTSGTYTDSCPVCVFKIVACTNAPRLAALAMVQPDWSGDIPSGPVSWYGVASPRADSGFAGTMMSQLTLAAAAALASAVGSLAVAVALEHGAAVAVPVSAGAVAVSVSAGAVAVLVPVAAAVAASVSAGAVVVSVAAGPANAAAEAQIASAESLTRPVRLCATATTAPTATTSATGMAMVTAIRRLAWFVCRRRHADRCLLGMQSTSMS